MWRRFALAVVTAIGLQAPGMTTNAQAQASTIPCDAFEKNADGSWTVLQTTFIEGPAVKVQEGAILRYGFLIRGADIAAMIDKACPNAAPAPANTATAPGTSATRGAGAPPSQPPQLARFADANGNIDVRQLTCGHLDDTSAEEADLFLAWYSGWYNGLAKRPGINVAKVRYVSSQVMDYCKANRDKKLVDVMELRLK